MYNQFNVVTVMSKVELYVGEHASSDDKKALSNYKAFAD